MCAKNLGHLCKIESGKLRTKISVQILDPNVAAAASNQSKTYRSPIFMWDLMIAIWNWKRAGKPPSPTNLLTMKKKEATKRLRSEQRILAAELQDQELQDIMDVDSSNKKLFFKLIQKQRWSSCTPTNELLVDGILHNTPESILTDWRSHFEQPPRPK